MSVFVAGAAFGGIWVDDEFVFGSCSDHGRIMLESSSIVNFGKFLLDFGVQFYLAGAVFGEVGG